MKKIVKGFRDYFKEIQITDLGDVLEWLADLGLLNDKGEQFREEFWQMYAKDEYKKWEEMVK